MLSTFLTIALLHWVVLATPGVNFVLIAQLAAGSTRSVSLAAVAGITTVTFLWASLAILGMGAIFCGAPCAAPGLSGRWVAPIFVTSPGSSGAHPRPSRRRSRR